MYRRALLIGGSLTTPKAVLTWLAELSNGSVFAVIALVISPETVPMVNPALLIIDSSSSSSASPATRSGLRRTTCYTIRRRLMRLLPTSSTIRNRIHAYLVGWLVMMLVILVVMMRIPLVKMHGGLALRQMTMLEPEPIWPLERMELEHLSAKGYIQLCSEPQLPGVPYVMELSIQGRIAT
jgi:hypothetical protein